MSATRKTEPSFHHPARVARYWFPLITLLIVAGVHAGRPMECCAAEGQLETPKLQKAAVTCQKVVDKVASHVLAKKFTAFDACANTALSCVLTKRDRGDCGNAAGKVCVKKLESIEDALKKAQVTIAKLCTKELNLSDLLSADGLGLGAIAGSCRKEFGLDICEGVVPVAECLVGSRARAALALYGDVRPGTREVLNLLPVVLPPIDGLPPADDCQNCSVPSGREDSIEKCGKTLTKLTKKLLVDLGNQFVSCGKEVHVCVELHSSDEQCLVKAQGKCDKGAKKLPGLFAKFVKGIEKKCSGEGIFEGLAFSPGINIDALKPECSALGVASLATAADLAACLKERVECGAATLVRQSFPRIEGFAASNLLGQLAANVVTVCPSMPTIALAASKYPRLGLFGSIFKFVRQITRAGIGAVPHSGSPPASSLGSNKGVLHVGGPVRVSFGQITKVPFTYKLQSHSVLSRERLAEEAPMLIVGVQAEGESSADYFEIALDPDAPSDVEVNDELELTYGDVLPVCSFTLFFATRVGADVSDYTPLVLTVEHAFAPATPTPLPPTPTATPTQTVSATIAQTTPPTRTASPTAPGVIPTPGPGFLSFGSNVTSAIGQLGAIDSYKFAGNTGDPVVIRATENGGSEPCIELHMPNGSLVDTKCSGNEARINTTLPTTGTFTILVYEQGGDETMAYGLALQRLVVPGNATFFAYGDNSTGSITKLAEITTFTFSGTDGDVIVLRSTENGGSEPCVELYAPDGSSVGGVCNSGEARLNTTLPSTGAYTALVYEQGGDEGLTYGLALQRLFAPGNATAIAYGDNSTGSITKLAELETFTFAGIGGDVIVLRSTENGGSEPCVELYGPDGSSVGGLCGSGEARLNTTLPSTGAYTALVYEQGGDEGLGYGLALQRLVSPGKATSIVYGNNLSGSITHLAEMNTFTFSGTPGDVIVLRSTENGGSEPCVELYAPDASLVGGVCGAGEARIDATLPATGLYAVLVYEQGGDEGLSYGVALTKLN